MKYLKTSSLNPMTGVLETVKAEGYIGERPWVALECVEFGCDTSFRPGRLQYDYGLRLPYRIIRIRCTDLGLRSYLFMLTENWLNFCKNLVKISNSVDGVYNIRFNGCPYALWDGECEKTGEFYAEFDISSSMSDQSYQAAVEKIMKEMSVIFIRMAAVGP